MLLNDGPSQQSSKEEYKPWKWGATARYYTSHTKTMLPTTKPMPRSSRQLDHTKTSWPLKRRKLQWYDHVSHSSGLAKTILQGMVKGGRRQGRQRKRWEDNIREWTGLEFGRPLRTVENREKWRKLAAKSSVVPQRPSWLRNRWDDMRVGTGLAQLRLGAGWCIYLCNLDQTSIRSLMSQSF